MSTKRLTGVTGLLVLLVILGAATMIISNLRLRVDLTADRLYTLSQGSRKILGELPVNVTMKLYYSASAADMPMGVKTYATKVQDLLKEYELAGRGRLTLELYDPKPDSDAEEWAQRYGVEPQQVNPFGMPVYFGLVAVAGEQTEVLAGFNPRNEPSLEYDLTRLVTRVAWPEKPVIGVLSTLEVFAPPANPMMMQQPQHRGWAAFRELRKDYVVREIPADATSIDDDVKTLVVVHPKNLSDETLYALDQFVLRGGRMMVCVDPFSVADMSANQPQNPMMQMGGGQAGPSTLGKLFEAWGIAFESGKVVADMAASTKLNAGDGRVDDNPAFLSLGKVNMASEELLTSQLTQVMLPFAGAIVDNTEQGMTFSALIKSSRDHSCDVDQMNAQFGMSAMRSQLNPDGNARVLAARLQGTFKTAFPHGVTDETTAATNAPAGHLSSGNSIVLVFGDTDFVDDRFCVQAIPTLFGNVMQPINDNLVLFGNAVEQLAGREELISVRSRGQFSRPFTRVDKLEAQAMQKWQAEEGRLEAALQETRQRLAELQQQKSGNERMIISREQQAEIEQFRKAQADTSKQLKEVRKSLNRDIERLGLQLKVANIVVMPLLVIAFGLFRGLKRRKN
ncbi:MAG: Gldg family protein [Desulfuromonadaceae bacterium]|nr:Gldg family protein [Desulfuromonadaceae bacterium]